MTNDSPDIEQQSASRQNGSSSGGSVEEQRAAFAAAFDREIDPLEQFEETFKATPNDPFETFLNDVIRPQGLAEDTIEAYERSISQWKTHMDHADRHPACPTEDHVRTFAESYLDRNTGGTVQKKLHRLNKAYEYWQNDPAFPHPVDYNPFRLVLSKLEFPDSTVKEPPRIPIQDLAEHIRGITHIRDRAIVVAQCKLGLRAGEVCNIQLQDVHLENTETQQFYDDLGTHPVLEGRENAIYIPAADERSGNKSRRPRVLPLDAEMRRVLLRWLLIRPDTGEPWVFLSKQLHTQLGNEGINNIWLEYFHPEYAETEDHREVTSHFGRHRFTTYWQVEQDVNRELVKYMRGDKSGGSVLDGRGAIDEYIHTYYEDVEELYRDRIFRFDV